MKFDILTLFPEMIDAVMQTSIIGRAQQAGLVSIQATNIRDFTLDKHNRVDDTPYGGGKGMVMQADPLFRCHQHVTGGKHVHTVLMSAQGKPFCQEKARELLAHEHLVIVCGHYEGIDQRFIDECVDEEISIGDFVLTGGEIPAMAVTDAVCPHGSRRAGRGGLFHRRKPLERLIGVSAVPQAGCLARPRGSGGSAVRSSCQH